MSRAAETLEAFLTGRMTQDELLQRLQAEVAANAAAGAAWLQAIGASAQRQAMPPDLLVRINAIATPGDQTLLRPEAQERTVRIPPPKPQDDTTRIRPVQDLYASPGMTRLRSPGPAPAGADAPPEAGMVIRERYVLETILGQGGMGQVWKARDQLREQTHPFVALKLLSPDFEAHPDAYAALQSEAAKSQQLAHPNIATVFDFDLDRAAGRAFLTMELLEGQTLESYIRSAPAGHPRAKVLPILRGLAAGLAYAHTRRIVHSDFKPANVFLTDTGTAKILDFGIARVTREGQLADSQFHAESLAALTMAYASPEMFRGDDAHPADDMYALGIVAYELLTGSHPFKRQRADKVAPGTVPARIKGLRGREWRAIQRCLSFERATRWQNAAAFLKALEGINPWIKALGATALVLASIAAWSGYQNYLESKPQVPFSALAPEVQREFQQAMSEGNDALDFGTRRVTGQEAASALYREAFGSFASAYAMHPKNPDADAGMRKTLDALSKQLQGADAETRTEARAVLAEYSSRYTVLSKYGPLNKLLGELD